MSDYQFWRKSHPDWPKRFGDWEGRKVKLKRDMETRSGTKFKAGETLFVSGVSRGLHLSDKKRYIRGVDPQDVELLPNPNPLKPKEVFPMRRQGMVKIDEVKLEGGLVIPIYLQKEDGVFRADLDIKIQVDESTTTSRSESWSGKELEKVRRQIHEWHEREKLLKWEPMIIGIEDDRFSHTNKVSVLGCQFERCFRAKNIKGDGYEWRAWSYRKTRNGVPVSEKETIHDFIRDDDFEPYDPGADHSGPHKSGFSDQEPTVIPYTPERWKSILALREMENALRARLKEILGAGEKRIDQFLTAVRDRGLLGLEGPKPEKES